MCIVDQITFGACKHKSYFLLFPCSSGFSVFDKRCNANSHVTRKQLRSTKSYGTKSQTYCRTCFQSTLKMIREDYAKKYLDLEGEARSLGWSKADISGSVTEMQLEMDEALGEWKVSCGQENEKEEQTLDAFAESIRFQFGPPLLGADASTLDCKPYLFSAGKADKMRKYSLGKAQSRAIFRARARATKTGRLYPASRLKRLLCAR